MKPISMLAGVALTAGAIFAQESRATVIGRVVDPSGALIAGAKVRATNTETNAGVSTVSNDNGNFEIPYLLPGTYRVDVELDGFKKAVRDGIALRVNDRLTLDFTLELGSVAESVVVTGETPLLEAATASVGMVMDERRVSELPMVGGNPFYLARLAPGVIASGGRSAGNPMDNGAATDVIVNGTRSGSSEVMVDGVANMTNRSAVFSPPQDLVQEFKIQTATYDASIGHAAGAMTNVSMKSGTNRLHGTGYYFDSRIRAVPWFTNRFLYDPRNNFTPEQRAAQIPSWFHQRWGTTLSGPVWIPKIYDGRNRTFWTFGFEDLNISRNLTLTATVPTEAQLRGDFSPLLRRDSTYQIYDPRTITPAPNGRFARQPLPGNIVPASRIDPLATKLLSFYPQPNQPGTGDFQNNYFRTRNIFRQNYTYVTRVDHNFSEKNRFFLRVNNSQHDNKADFLPSIATGDLIDRTGWGAAIDDVYVINPGLLVNFRYGITVQNQLTSRFSQGFDLGSLGFPSRLINEINSKNQVAGIAFPQVVIDGGAFYTLGANGGSDNSTVYHNFGSTLTRISGSHSMRFGAELRVQREFNYGFGNVAPRIDFAQTWTRGPLDTSPVAPIGQGLASMLLGLPTGGEINTNASNAQQSNYWAFFVHDDWRVTPRLTVNAGLRYEYESPTTERFNRSIKDFDFSAASPVSAAALANYNRSPIPELPVSQFRTFGGLRFAGNGGLSRDLWSGDRNNFAPRVGLAYQINKLTVFRAGYGIFFDVLGVDRQDVNQGGFNQPTNLIPSLDNGQTFAATLSNPFPNGLEVPPGASGGLNTFLGRAVSFFQGSPLNPYMQRWSASIQRELPGRVVMDVSYVGNRGTKLAVATQLNPVPREYLSTSPVRDQAAIDNLARQVNNPFFGIPEFAGTGLGNLRVGLNQLLRPFPHFTGITASFPAGYSHYHSMQTSVEKRFSKGLTFQTSWTWSKFMQATGFLNETDPYLEKVVSDQDFTHRFVFSGIFELPFGRGQKWMNQVNRLADAVLGGWQLQGWFEGQTGDALGFGNAIFTGDLKNVPIPVSERRAERWFNVDAGFERSNARQLGSNLRTLNSRFNGIRADGINNFDLSMFKIFRIKEGIRARFGFESFNALNHVQLASPNTAPVNTAFGTINDEKGHGQRQITMSLKLQF
ncbi:MAG: hypothetical protein FJW39_02825 [Acidobacteria bacterium]|nr:hypothetical protein [Acidobacteriota bacterium]